MKHSRILPRKDCRSSRPLIIPVFIPHAGCPHQCVFCNQSAITGHGRADTPKESGEHTTGTSVGNADILPSCSIPGPEQIRQEVENFLGYRGSRKKVELAFFGGNFLGLSTEAMLSLLNTALILFNEDKINGIRFSTRPDTITKEKLELISSYPVSTVELGVQSMDDTVLQRARRGHSCEDTVTASTLLKQFGCSIGMQMMTGLPGDSDEIALDTARKIAGLYPDFVRIYPLMVLKGSQLAAWYRQGRYQPMSLKHCLYLVKEIFLIFKQNHIPVIRMGLQSSDLMQDKKIMLAGPWHPAFGHLVYSELFFDKLLGLIREKERKVRMESKGTAPVKAAETTTMTITVHPSSLSRLQGNRKENLKRLSKIFPSTVFTIKTDCNLGKEDILL